MPSCAAWGKNKYNKHRSLFPKLVPISGGTSGPSNNLDHAIRVIDLETRTESFAPLSGHQGYLHGISYDSKSNVLASASEDGTVKIWDLRSPKGRAQGKLTCTLISSFPQIDCRLCGCLLSALNRSLVVYLSTSQALLKL